MIYVFPFVASVILTVIYIAMWHKHFDVHLSLIFTCIPISQMGYVALAYSRNIEAAVLANKIIYIGGCFLPLLITLSIMSLCKINIPNSVSALLFLSAFGIYGTVWTIGIAPLFYSSYDFAVINGIGQLVNKEYGFAHTSFYAIMVAYILIGIIAIIYSYSEKKEISRSIILLLIIPEFLSIFSFFGGKIFSFGFEILPYTFPLAQIVYLIIVYRVSLYDIDDSVVDSLVESGDTGFVSVDLKNRYLGSNETAKKIMPWLSQVYVDSHIDKHEEMSATFKHWITEFQSPDRKNVFRYECGDRVYTVTLRPLFNGKKRGGYQFFFTDDTSTQKYIKLLDNYNADLEQEVETKTTGILEMHDKLIMAMAMMVESRDNSTGGHIMRTSRGVQLLIDEIIKDGSLPLSDKFCKDIVKAAPMHDLGKVAVPDQILSKPGRFTPEEFDKMKMHSAEGAKIVHRILQGTDDHEFHRIAENVAHYHHERWDGSGYPEGLKGEDIPIEARIMAIADVYDALVSKRVYKESMSFEEADKIIMESFGKHFDKNLEKYYIAARPNLEAYYTELSNNANEPEVDHHDEICAHHH